MIDDCLIESELAAKSTLQTNRVIVNYISQLPKDSRVLDYGCGKLRYSLVLAKQVKEVFAIDSDFQLSKVQTINRRKTTCIDYANEYTNNVYTYSVDSEHWKKQEFDYVFCTNVLSAIPNDGERLTVLLNARKVLKATGRLIISVQNRNSYFKGYQFRQANRVHNDGWLIHRKDNKYSFYGIITEEKISSLCHATGLIVKDEFKQDGSIFVEAVLGAYT